MHYNERPYTLAVSDSDADLLAGAQEAVAAAQHDPQAALDAALEILAAGSTNPQIEATAHWAAGLAQREFNRLTEAEDHLVRAIAVASEAGLPQIAALARISRALVLTYLGRAEAGLAELDLAEPDLGGAQRSRAQMQRALIMQRLGRLDEALAGYAQALPGLIAGGDHVAEVRLRANRGIALTYRNELLAADADLVRAREIAAELGQSMQVAACSHNLGFLHGRRGDVPRSLGWFDRARTEYARLGVDGGLNAVLLADRADVLLDAGLANEALQCSRRALGLLADTANSVDVAEAQLALARAALAAGDDRLAQGQAVAAAELFDAQGRATWAALARYLAFISAEATRTTDVSTSYVDQAQTIADDLAAAGWSLEASTARSLVGRLALQAGDLVRADRELAVAATARTSGSAIYQVGGWYAEALRRTAAGDRRGARRAVRAGLTIIDRHRATLGAADLRAHVATHGDRLADLLMSLAIQGRRARDILAAAESWRAGSLSIPVTPPRDPILAERLSALRALAAERRGGNALEPSGDLGRLESEIRDLARSRPASGDSRLEGEIRDLARSGPERGANSRRAQFDHHALAAQLGDRMLVEWVVHQGQLSVVWVVDGRTRWSPLQDIAPALPEIQSIRMCLNRLARGLGSSAWQAIMRTTLAESAARLSTVLFGPIAAQAAEHELVLVPTGPLHAVPWSALEPVRRSPSVIAPSASAWLAASTRPLQRTRLLIAGGPDLPGAAAEVDALARSRPDALVLRPAEATVAAVMEALPEVNIAHLAAHGTFRTDNPQFSSLHFADGALTVYDLETLRRVPDILVLSACDAAAVNVRPGDELLGLSAALLGMGTSSLIAPSVPVPDDATVALMVALQERLAAGERAPVALWRAIGGFADSEDSRVHSTIRSFVTLGA